MFTANAYFLAGAFSILLTSRNPDIDGIMAMQSGNYARAIYCFSCQIHKDPRGSSAFFNRGSAYMATRRFDLALADYNQVVSLGKPSPAAYVQRGKCHANTGDLVSAIRDCSTAIMTDPTMADAWLNRGCFYAQSRRYNDAIGDFSQAVKLHPKLVDAFAWRGLAYCEKSDYELSIEDFDKAIELDRTCGLAHFGRAHALSKLGKDGFTDNLKNAVRCFSNDIEQSPTDPGAYLLRGKTYSKLQQFSKARADYERALHLEAAETPMAQELVWLLATCPEGDSER
jgi:tetratricopeptide (TPR) repeat protein